MKLNCRVIDAQILTKKVIQGKVKPDGTHNIYYVLGLKVNDELGEMNCSLDVYDTVILNKSYDLEFAYETKFDKNYIKIERIFPASVDKK